jgi:hypothetical protein
MAATTLDPKLFQRGEPIKRHCARQRPAFWRRISAPSGLMCFLAVAALLPVATPALFQDLFVLDCTGTLTVFPGSTMEMKLQHLGLPSVHEAFLQNVKTSYECMCGQLSSEWLDYHFRVDRIAIDLLSQNPSAAPASGNCPNVQTLRTLFSFLIPTRVELPSSCTPSQCLISLPLRTPIFEGMSVHFAMKSCPASSGSTMPYISITTSGTTTAAAGQPCAESVPCPTSSTCVNFAALIERLGGSDETFWNLLQASSFKQLSRN